MRTGAQIVADIIAAWTMGPVFHVPGEGILDLLDACGAKAPAVRLVTARHEGGMAFMASGAARATGRPAVCLAARAPGALNACLGLHTAMTDGVPLLMIVGQADMAHWGRESFLDEDMQRVFAPLSKWVGVATDASRLPELLHRAWHVAMTGRRGPVVLIVAENIWRQQADAADLPPPTAVAAAPDSNAVAEVLTRLKAAQRPLVIVGGSDWEEADSASLRAVAQRFDLPVASAYRRRDLMDNADPRFVGEIGIGLDPALGRRIADADLLLVIGARLGELNTIGAGFHGYTLLNAPRPAQTLVHVHPCAAELNRVYRADIAILSAPGAFLTALAAGAAPATPHWHDWTQAARRDREAHVVPSACPGPMDLPALYGALRARLPETAGIAVGAGAYALWAQRFLPHSRPRTLFGPKSGAMGYGLPAAIGAAVACPERRFIALAGDGCFLMQGEELATAVRERLPIVTLVFNNASYGAIRLAQQRGFGRATGTDLSRVDFAAFARSFGAHGETVTRTEEFAPAFDRAWTLDGPSVLDVAVPPEATRPT